MERIITFKRKNCYVGDDYYMEYISKDRMWDIENKVKNIIKDIDFKVNPCIDITKLVKSDNFTVTPTLMDEETTGVLYVNGDNRMILVNKVFKNPDKEEDVVFKKSRFITAHEYGHYILHKEKGKPIYAHRDTYHRTEPIELEADYFARSILMPLDIFKKYYDILNNIGGNDRGFTTMVLSKIFNVTRNKVNKRMEDLLTLGLIKE